MSDDKPLRPLVTDWMSVDQIRPHLRPGDLIEFKRMMEYAHWGVYIGDDNGEPEVVHLAAEGGDFGAHFSSIQDVLNGRQQVGNVIEQFLNNPTAQVRLDPLRDVAGGSPVRVNHLLDEKHPPFEQDVVVMRALEKLHEPGYHLVNNNCEHFVNYCRYDQKISLQVLGFFDRLNRPPASQHAEKQMDMPLD